MLVEALVFPHLEYCSGLLLSLTEDLWKRLERCKNAALRFVSGVSRFDHITPTYVSLEILPFTLRSEYLCICLIVSKLANKEPQPIFGNFSFREPDKPGSKRCHDLLLTYKKPRTDCHKYHCS